MGCIFSKDEDTFDDTPTSTGGGMTKQKSGFRDPSIMLQKVSKAVSDLGSNAPNVKDKAREAAHHVRNIFATPIEMLDLQAFTMPVHAKTDEEKEFIQKALKNNFVFEHLEPKELKPLILAFENHHAAEKEVIIKQGETGDYFYIIRSGSCSFEVDGKEVGHAKEGDSFGELALLYNCPRAATVTALAETDLYRVNQKTFRYILQVETKKRSEDKIKLLRGVPFLKNLGYLEMSKLANAMTPKRIEKGEYLIHKGDKGDNFYIVAEGAFKATNIDNYEDIEMKPGSYFGERALVTGEPRAADIIAETESWVWFIDKDTFANVLGSLDDLILRSEDKAKLSGIKLIKDSELDSQVLSSLVEMIVDRKFSAGTKIMEQGKKTEAALYIIRSGKVQVTTKEGQRDELGEGKYFGSELLRADVISQKNKPTDPTTTVADCTVTVLDEDCVCGVLTLAKCRTVLDTRYLGTKHEKPTDSITEKEVALKDLKRHTILGAGTFGQVWLVSRETSAGKRQPYALKIQSKYELCQEGQAKAVVNEKNVMAKMNHPFLIQLVGTYKDDHFVYMLLGLVQGGELYSVIHTSRRSGVPEKDARFYAAGISEGLAHMHRRGYVYRDLKPENVLVDDSGYCVIVDFGFAKYVKDKTYTLCGTPLYLAPEVILNRGHNWGADHWSLGVMIYEMITGDTPFYKEGMEQMDLFRAIVKCKYTVPRKVSQPAASMIQGLITKDPSQRLGSLKGGEDDILDHVWFESIDFDQLRAKEIKAPYVPKIKDPLDASNFEKWDMEDKTKQKYPGLSREQKAIFDDF